MLSIKYSIKAPDSVKDIPNKFKKKLKDQIKVGSNIRLKNAAKKKKPSDIFLVFLPVVSRTGTDIDAAVNNIKDLNDELVILVVLHHTFDPEAVVSDSSKFVNRKNTYTVDCLFYEDIGLLDCKRNAKAYENAVEWLKSMKATLKQKKAERKGSPTNPGQLSVSES